MIKKQISKVISKTVIIIYLLYYFENKLNSLDKKIQKCHLFLVIIYLIYIFWFTAKMRIMHKLLIFRVKAKITK